MGQYQSPWGEDMQRLPDTDIDNPMAILSLGAGEDMQQLPDADIDDRIIG
jgi:hypothetical protein